MYQTPAVRILWRNAVTGQQEIHCLAERDHARQVVDGVARKDASFHLEEAEIRLRRANTDVTVQRPLQATGKAEPVDRGDKWLRIP